MSDCLSVCFSVVHYETDTLDTFADLFCLVIVLVSYYRSYVKRRKNATLKSHLHIINLFTWKSIFSLVRIRYGYSWFWGKYHKKTTVEVEPAGYIPVEEIIEKTRGCNRILYRLKGVKGDYDLEAPMDDIFLPHEAHKRGWGAFDDYTVVFQ